MKKLVSVLLAAAMVLSLAALAGCHKDDYVPEGGTDVDYGEVKYVRYDDGSALTFDYLDCFSRSSDEEESFVANTEDDKSVLSYEFFDSYKDYEHTTEYYKVPSRKYAEIAAYSDEEALDYMKIALGMVSSQGAEYTVDGFKFEKNEGYLMLSLEVTAKYQKTGEIQKLWIVKYVVENERVYTIQAFAPKSLDTKYGPAFKGVEFDLENAVTNGVTAGENGAE